MKRGLNLLLLILLLTLPLRDYAAATGCGVPTRGHEVVSTPHGPAVDTAAAHQHEIDSFSLTHHHGDRSDKGAAVHHVSDTCCAGAISDTHSGLWATGIIAASPAIEFFDHPHSGFIPDGPERPPRPTLC